MSYPLLEARKPQRWSLNPEETRAPWMWAGCVASWPCWEGSNGAHNIIGNNEDTLTLYDTAGSANVNWRLTKYGPALEFVSPGGSSGFAGPQASSGPLKFTAIPLSVELLMYPTAISGTGNASNAFSTGDTAGGNSAGFNCFLGTNSYISQIGDGAGSGVGNVRTITFSNGASQLNKLQHVIYTFAALNTASFGRCFVGGRDMGAGSTSGIGTVVGYAAGSRVSIGGQNASTNGPYIGLIYAVNVFRRIIHANEAKARAYRFWDMYSPAQKTPKPYRSTMSFSLNMAAPDLDTADGGLLQAALSEQFSVDASLSTGTGLRSQPVVIII